ncbi:MAG: hypothetical protein ABWY55_07880 [Microbacterium sp.]
MHNAMQFVLSNPMPGMAEEYNEWYAGPHMDHTLQTEGVLAGQRFARREGPWPGGRHDYLTIWEMDDPAATLAALNAVKFTSTMPISPAIDMMGLQPPTMWHRASVRNAARPTAEANARPAVVLVLANAAEDRDAEFERDLMSAGLARLADQDGVHVAHFFTLGDEQIRGNARKYRYGMLIELYDTAPAIEALGPLIPGLPELDAERWLAPVFTALGPRATSRDE